MYAIVEIQGQQFKAEAGKFLYVHYLGDVKEGDTVEFDRVLLLDADGDVKIGAANRRIMAPLPDPLPGILPLNSSHTAP